ELGGAVGQLGQVPAREGVTQQRSAHGDGVGPGGEPGLRGLEVHAPGGDHAQLGEGPAQVLDVPRADDAGGEDLHGARAGGPGRVQLGGGQPAGHDRHAAGDRGGDHGVVGDGGDQVRGLAVGGAPGLLDGGDGAHAQVDTVAEAPVEIGQGLEGAGGGQGQLHAAHPGVGEGRDDLGVLLGGGGAHDHDQSGGGG